ncbi:MAG: hypothetical protein KC777_26430 [Cyanobacteria bacterium HKST-UBA02]|nr:hypothetical protein [Cyanobacteria bacterium HKST-UBA02]
MFFESGRENWLSSVLRFESAFAGLLAYIYVLALALAPAGWFEPVSLLAFARALVYVMFGGFAWSVVPWIVIGIPALFLEFLSGSYCHISRFFAIPLFFLLPVYGWSGYWHVRCGTGLGEGSWQYDVLMVLGFAAIIANLAGWFIVGKSHVWRDCRISAFCILWHELLLAVGSLYIGYLALCAS